MHHYNDYRYIFSFPRRRLVTEFLPTPQSNDDHANLTEHFGRFGALYESYQLDSCFLVKATGSRSDALLVSALKSNLKATILRAGVMLRLSPVSPQSLQNHLSSAPSIPGHFVLQVCDMHMSTWELDMKISYLKAYSGCDHYSVDKSKSLR